MQGATALEFDVRLTRDGEVVVHHDVALGRVFPGESFVEECEAADLAALRTQGGEGMPTLRETLSALPADVLLDIEIKADAQNAAELPRLVHAIVEEHGALDRALVTSFDGELASEYAALARRPGGHITPYAPDEGDVSDWPLLGFAVVAEGALDKETVDVLRQAGKSVLAWTVNDAARAEALLAMGVAGIVTDRPGRLLARLRPDASAP